MKYTLYISDIPDNFVKQTIDIIAANDKEAALETVKRYRLEDMDFIDYELRDQNGDTVLEIGGYHRDSEEQIERILK